MWFEGAWRMTIGIKKTPPPQKCLFWVVRLQFWRALTHAILLLLPDWFWPAVVMPVRILSINQNWSVWKLLVFDQNTWNHKTVQINCFKNSCLKIILFIRDDFYLLLEINDYYCSIGLVIETAYLCINYLYEELLLKAIIVYKSLLLVAIRNHNALLARFRINRLYTSAEE